MEYIAMAASSYLAAKNYKTLVKTVKAPDTFVGEQPKNDRPEYQIDPGGYWRDDREFGISMFDPDSISKDVIRKKWWPLMPTDNLYTKWSLEQKPEFSKQFWYETYHPMDSGQGENFTQLKTVMKHRG